MSNTEPKLKRNIGLIALTLYGIGDILGAGIYGLVGKAAGEMGSAAWMGFLVSMCAAGLTGLSYASLGSRYPKAAGAVFATSRAFNKGFLSYIVGLALLASGLTSMATASRAFSGYFSGLFLSLPIPLIIAGFALALTFIVFWGIRESLWANAVCTVIEVSGLLLIIILGISFLGETNYLNAVTESNPEGNITIPLMLGGAVLTFYSFIGFEDMLNVAEEVKNPKKNIPRALISAVALSSVIYILICLIAVSVIPSSELAHSKQPLVDVMGRIAPWFPSPLFTVIALFAVANTALLNFIMGSRLLYGMSAQGLFPSLFSKVHPTRNTPHRTVLLVGAILLVLAFVGEISTLARATSVLLLLCFVVVNISLVVLQRKEKIPGTFEVPSFVPVLGSLVCLAMLSQTKLQEWLIAGSILIVITVLYFVLRPSANSMAQLGELD
ncbi:MAG: amino acid permease [Oligoflexia bacterium]|nr:amino acid permease [Oligoflexia bacterium]